MHAVVKQGLWYTKEKEEARVRVDKNITYACTNALHMLVHMLAEMVADRFH